MTADTDTMDDVDSSEAAFEATNDEQQLLTTLRDKRLSATDVKDRINAATRPREPEATAEKPVTATEAKKLVSDGVALAQRQHDAVSARREIESTIGAVIDKADLPDLGDRRDHFVKDVMKAVQGREDIEKLTALSDSEFKKVVTEEASKRMEAETKYVAEASEAGRAKKQAESKAAADAVGQTSEAGPPPRSNASTEHPAHGPKVTPDNMEGRFGLGQDWSRTESEHLQEQSRAATGFLTKARGAG